MNFEYQVFRRHLYVDGGNTQLHRERRELLRGVTTSTPKER